MINTFFFIFRCNLRKKLVEGHLSRPIFPSSCNFLIMVFFTTKTCRRISQSHLTNCLPNVFGHVNTTGEFHSFFTLFPLSLLSEGMHEEKSVYSEHSTCLQLRHIPCCLLKFSIIHNTQFFCVKLNAKLNISHPDQHEVGNTPCFRQDHSSCLCQAPLKHTRAFLSRITQFEVCLDQLKHIKMRKYEILRCQCCQQQTTRPILTECLQKNSIERQFSRKFLRMTKFLWKATCPN